MPRFAANLSMMYVEHPFLERFAAAAADGFTAVEYLFPYEWPADTLAGKLKESGLEQVLFNAPPGDFANGERGVASLPGREEEFRSALARALDYAAALGCPRVHLMAGLVPAGATREALRPTYLKNLEWAATRAADAGVDLLIEPINTRDRPNYFLTRIEQAADIIAKVGRPNVRIQFDFYHVQIVSGDLIMRFEKHLPLIGHVQIAAVPSRAEPDEGEINYPAVFAALDRLGWKGWTACEYKPRGRTEDGLGWGEPFGIKSRSG